MGRTTNKHRRAESQQTARERAAAMRLEQQRRERRTRLMTITGVTLGLLAIAGGIIAYALTRGSSSNSPGASKVFHQIANVSNASLQSAGTSGVNQGFAGPGIPASISDPPLTENGKPELLYIGAEFCPYCAGERWAMGVALSRFGTLGGLAESRSGTTDGDLATLTFRHATYQSNYLTFTPIEAQDRNHNQLANPTPAQTALWEKYTGKPPNGPGYPFLDFGGKYVATDPTFDPLTVLKGLSQAQIAKDLDNPSSEVGKAIDTNANYLTAAICGMTGNKPASVCTASIQAIEKKLPAHQASTPATGSTASPSS